MPRNIIVFDTVAAPFLNNQAFSPNSSRRHPETHAWIELAKIAGENGWEMMTSDVFLRQKPVFSEARCISFEYTRNWKALDALEVDRRVLISTESPNISWDFYHDLARHSRGFKHAYLFRGCLERVNECVNKHHHHWANLHRKPGKLNKFSERQMAVMVASFRHRYWFNRLNPLSWLYAPIRWSKIAYYQLVDEMARFPDLYQSRLRLISHWASKKEFYLYGRYWDIGMRFSTRIQNIKFANAPVECGDKIDILSRFKFNLVFENCIFPGYITEKLFDAMHAGTVPVYLGAPDILDFIPKECFVDLRDYDDLDELWNDLASWDIDLWNKKIKNINDFMASDLYIPYKAPTVAEKYFRWLTE